MTKDKPANITVIQAAFLSSSIPIEGIPTILGLVRILKHIMNCVKSHRTPVQALGKLYIFLTSVLLSLHVTTPYPSRCANPGAQPFCAPVSDGTARAKVENIFTLNHKAHHDKNNMDKALIKQFYGLLDPTHTSDLREVMLAHVCGPATFVQKFEYAMQKWGTSTATSRMANRNRIMNA